jgi:Putative transposase/Transposase zinc-binding domain
MTTSIVTKNPGLEIADLFMRFGDVFLEKHPQPAEHHSFINLIKSCRTQALGGHIQRCDTCDYATPVYNSCQCRMCPKCQSLKRERWVEARKSDLLPCKYFHGVFTLPHTLNPIALWNKKQIYKALFDAVSETLQTFARSELNGRLGFITVLHTWNQKLLDHIHLHCLIPAGALDPKTKKWNPCKSDSFLFPVFAVSKVFRAKFIERLRSIQNDLKLPTSLGYLKDPISFQDFLDDLFKEDFVVYTKQPFSGPEQVIEYLGRYVHRVAISNRRIIKVEGDTVHFSYRDRQDGNQEKVLALPVTEFLRRFMLHSVPKGFQRIRHHGILANRSKKLNVERIYLALAIARVLKLLEPLSARDFILKKFGRDISQCPHCKQGQLHHGKPIPKARSP